jgi:hypothetical protein
VLSPVIRARESLITGESATLTTIRPCQPDKPVIGRELLIRRRMLCSSRWVIPGLAEGVTGWPAGQRVAGGSRSSGGCRHRGEKWPALTAAGGRACRCDRAGSGVQARRLTGLLRPTQEQHKPAHPGE